MKFRAHDTFFIRRGWLHKGMKHVCTNPSVFLGREGASPMDTLGIGANMVKSLRYWLQAVGLTEETTAKRREQTFTEFGKLIWTHDPYFEEIGTLWLLHYKLVTSKNDAPAWFYFFNSFRLQEFSRDDFVTQISSQLRHDGEEVPERSLDDDFNCIISTYLPRFKSNPEKVNPESNIDCPLGELGLVDIADRRKKHYKKSTPGRDSIPPLILLAVLIDKANGAKEIRIPSIQNEPCQAGKVFNLDVIALTALLYKIEHLKHIKVVRTAGLDVVQFKSHMTFVECIEAYYRSISE